MTEIEKAIEALEYTKKEIEVLEAFFSKDWDNPKEHRKAIDAVRHIGIVIETLKEKAA